ncbi:putative serine protease [Prochlorococcus sp. SS52]|nr:putative serine protease [Prochlorococcus marinus str. SS2]KGG35434.1 putative serine protease [Prochlorococcus sp. SS52]
MTIKLTSKTISELMKKYKPIYGYALSLLILGTNTSARTAFIVPLTSQIERKQFQLIANKSFVSEALKKSGPAVVTIETQRKVFTNNRNIFPPNLLIDPNFERFFANPNRQYQRPRIERGQGSGVIFASEGLVLTNAHVVENSEELMVGLSDGRRIPGRVVGQDYLTDLAVVRLKGLGPWPKAYLGNSEEIEVGDWAIAVGNPYGLEKTVTLGIISNLNRNVSQLGISDKRLNLIQTDAAINPGNSGGPLLNSQGEVIGINTLVRSGPGAGLGFAIPINKAIEIANQLASRGRAIHPMIGVNLSPTNGKGALIIYVLPGGPAEKRGLKVNDVIISINNKDVKNPQDVVNTINSNGISKKMKFLILRNNITIKIDIKPIDIRGFRSL